MKITAKRSIVSAILMLCLCLIMAVPSFADVSAGASSGASAGALSGSQSQINIGPSTSIIPREFPMPANTVSNNPGQGIFMGPYEKRGDWNALLPDFLLLKDVWTKADFDRATAKCEAKGKYELLPMADLAPNYAGSIKIIYDSAVTLKDIKKNYVVLAALTTYSGTKKEISYANLVLKAMEVNFEEVGAPLMIVSDLGDRLGSRTFGWNVNIGGSMSAIQPGAGNFGGTGSIGVGFGAMNATQSDSPYARVYLVTPIKVTVTNTDQLFKKSQKK